MHNKLFNEFLENLYNLKNKNITNNYKKIKIDNDNDNDYLDLDVLDQILLLEHEYIPINKINELFLEYDYIYYKNKYNPYELCKVIIKYGGKPDSIINSNYKYSNTYFLHFLFLIFNNELFLNIVNYIIDNYSNDINKLENNEGDIIKFLTSYNITTNNTEKIICNLLLKLINKGLKIKNNNNEYYFINVKNKEIKNILDPRNYKNQELICPCCQLNIPLNEFNKIFNT